MASRNGVKDEAQPGSILLVIHDFLARSADELSLAKGDRIELIERDDDFGDGWFLGRHMGNGSTGLFPEVYTTPAPKGTLTGGPHQRRVSEGVSKSAANDAATAASTQMRHSAGSSRPPNGSQGAMVAASAALRTSLPSPTTASSAARSNTFTNDSPVMNEALAVIDEHITDMHTPRSSYMNGNNKRDTMSSIYSQQQQQQQQLNRLSYIPGHETDEDEHALHTEAEVTAWSPEQVAEYLEDHGVERSHCDVFRDQEITGEVLLAMDQSSLFIKEFELGPVGRRLKTWHKIKALQDEVRTSSIPAIAKSASEYSVAGATEDDATSIVDVSRNRSSTVGAVFPRGLEPQRHSLVGGDGQSYPLQSPLGFPYAPQQAEAGAPANISRAPSDAISPLQNVTRTDKASRPSAQNIRAMQHARRHSSIDSTNSITSSRPSHRKVPSFDRAWKAGASMKGAFGSGLSALNTAAFAGGSQPTSPTSPSVSTAHARTKSSGSASRANNGALVVPGSPGDLDRGYFSSNELDNRATIGGKRNSVLTKKNAGVTSPGGSRTNSTLFSTNRQSTTSSQDAVSPVVGPERGSVFRSMTGAFGSKWSSKRSATSPAIESKPMANAQGSVSPIVTKLDYNDKPTSMNAALASSETSSKNASPSPSTSNLGFFGSQRSKITGLRAISDAVTNREKHQADSPTAEKIPPTLDEKGEPITSPSRTGSTTPSTEARSFDLQKSVDGRSRESTGSGNKLMPPQPTQTQRRTRPKSKKATSAYTRGLQKKTPVESMEDCDYSGWMKKKSGSLMTTWKTRLFILKGRRLSYYYSNDDTEEKGLIDISFHRVLPATDETLTSMHAAVTGAASSNNTASPTLTTPQTAAERDIAALPPKEGGGEDSGLFIFKLVPPKSGLSKGVNFTKPTVHYFAVNSRQEGRLWMAALMKATIDRDGEGVVTTTYNQKTISLAKARARKERPPALQEEEAESRIELDGSDAGSTMLPPGVGLGLGPFITDTSDNLRATVGGAEQDTTVSLAEDNSSIAPSAFTIGSTAPTAGGAEDAEKEVALDGKVKEAAALHAPA